MAWAGPAAVGTASLLTREWLVTNGLGGYASGTVAGVPTRRYHGFLIAALPAPLGRIVMLSQLEDRLVMPDGSHADLSGQERAAMDRDLPGASYLEEFRLELGLPVWRYRVGAVVVERRVLLPYRQNTVHVWYRQVEGPGPVRLEVRPALHPRPHEQPVSSGLGGPYSLTILDDRYEIQVGTDLPPLRLRLLGTRAELTVERETLRDIVYRLEAERGYESRGDLWIPGQFSAELGPDEDVVLVASTEAWRTIEALAPDQALALELERRGRLLARARAGARADGADQDDLRAELALAADQFIITPAGRLDDTARANARGDEVRTVIAGYHWFTDWGRDTMISLEGLTLTTGRTDEAGSILRTFARSVRDGLIPNLFPEGDTEGLYHTADATLWFFHALDRYLAATDDRLTLRHVLPTLRDIVAHHRRGTRFGIGVDPADGLLRQGAEGYQLTWMDAKVDDWVVTPRRGKAVEINALWYNALCLLAGWLRQERGDEALADELAAEAARVRESFNRRFFYEQGGYLFDVVDGEHGDDAALRPNQVLAISLPHPVLDRSRWEPVLQAVESQLLTPVGLRSLAPGHPDYKPWYVGDLRSRDAAYHQGTVWAWLIGPFVDAWLKLHPADPSAARRFLDGFRAHLGEAGIGSISEVFDAEAPFTPRGCIAQAWSVAEVLRCWVKTTGPASDPAGG